MPAATPAVAGTTALPESNFELEHAKFNFASFTSMARTMAKSSQRWFELDRSVLVQALEAEETRIVLLLAPAGYGKTTLARQWLANKRAAWFQADASATDVAALAADIAAAVSTTLPDAETKLLRHLHAVPRPDDNAVPLAKTLARELVDWPSDAWLVFDDYHLTMTSPASEAFVEALIEHSSVRMLITSRRRPSWVSTRRALYGEIFEIGQKRLAFRPDEAAQLLTDAPAEHRSAIFELSKGWPAVIALAARSPFSEVPNETLPAMLHGYFADELFQAASPDLQASLLRLSALPRLTPRLLYAAVGSVANEVCEEAFTLGFLTRDHDGTYSLHPLLRTFLVTKALEEFDTPTYIDRVISSLLDAKYWDDAFLAITEFARTGWFPRLLEIALDDLLAANRLATLSKWVEFGIASGCNSAFLHLAEAELARREGVGLVGEARALQALEGISHPSHKYRAYLVAGACAQQNVRMTDAAEHFRAAAEYAATPAEAMGALWGRFISELELERADLSPIVAEIANQREDAITSLIRDATIKLIFATRVGGLETEALAEANKIPLARRDIDPFVSTQFLYRLAYTHVLSAHYEVGLQVADVALEEARSVGLTFAIPHILAAQAAANIGRRNFRSAGRLIDQLEEASQGDSFEASNAIMLSARLAMTRPHGGERALELLASVGQAMPTRALQGECLGLRAVASASIGHLDDALLAATDAESATIELQAKTLALLARAIVAIQTGDPSDNMPQCALTASKIATAQNFDSFVCAYRAYPSLLKAFSQKETRSVLERVILRAADVQLAKSTGWPIVIPETKASLSRREKQVYGLMCEGRTNREISQALYISEATVKVHVRHIFEKLGVRSRTQAVLRLEQS